ncbi:MAG TPA: phosphate/phosphite/phosphonate ABC transporter substrate-binding protein [Candidatus Methylomirabilis sp.]|nr:phosphate/phosphite/phosphonate ABC transporter substrate-binding protein [Candidatus Methylomirabilis sp.]
MKRCRALYVVVVVFGFSVLAAGPGAAGEKPVKIGIMPTDTVKALVEKYQPLMDYLTRKTGQTFEVHPLTSYDEIISHLKSGDIDGGVLGSFKAYEAISRIGAVPVGRPEKGGVSSYRGYVTVRKDSGYKKIEDLKGKSFDFVSRGTSAGYIFPMAMLRKKKIEPSAFFSQMTFAGKHEITLAKVLNKESDGAALKDTTFEKLAKSDPRVNAELAVIHTSESFPDGTILFRKETPASIVKAVRQTLLGLEKDPEGKPVLQNVGTDRFILTDKKDFTYLAKLMKQMEGK